MWIERNKLVIMPKIDLLDNIVWILMQNRKYNLQLSGKILLDLENLYWKLFCLIYTDSEYKIELIPFVLMGYISVAATSLFNPFLNNPMGIMLLMVTSAAMYEKEAE